MSDGIWMVHTRGGSKLIVLDQVAKKESEGWKKLPLNHLNAEGRPKQMYWAQYDVANRGDKIEIMGEDSVGQLLQVEVL